MMEFVPDEQAQQDVPYYSDARAEEGWKGQASTKTVGALKSEVSAALGRLGGLVVSFQQGTYRLHGKDRQGFRIVYVLDSTVPTPGQIDIAALPVKTGPRRQKTETKRKEGALKMALFMLRNALEGQWFLQMLSPGYAALMPWLLDQRTGKTISQLWSDSTGIAQLLPPAGSDFIEAEFENA